VGAEVESSHLNAAEASNRIDAAEAALRAAQVSLDVAEQRYGAEVGIGTFIEVTDAQVNLGQAEVDRVQALYDYNTALAALRAAIGQAAVEGVQ
jgi:outer membrane protein TolC